MKLDIAGVSIMFRAIESFRYEDGQLIVRTVSGAEYSKEVLDAGQAQAIMRRALEAIAISDSL